MSNQPTHGLTIAEVNRIHDSNLYCSKPLLLLSLALLPNQLVHYIRARVKCACEE